MAPPDGSSPPVRRPFLKWVFVSTAEPRLRAGWRLLLQIVMQFVALVIIGVGIFAFTNILVENDSGPFSGAALLISQLADLIGLTVSVLVARLALDRRSFSSLGLQLDRKTWSDFAFGIAVTFLMMGMIFVVELALGWLRVTGFAWQSESPVRVLGGVGAFVVICLAVGWKEELMSRGYHLQTIASGTNLLWGWLVSSAVFGVLHLANPHANMLAVAGIILAGLLFGYTYIRTGALWMAMGLHTGWNFFEGVVFGFPVSGLSFYALPQVSLSGPELWTGGAFGPEAGLVLLPALALGFLLVALYCRKRGAAAIR